MVMIFDCETIPDVNLIKQTMAREFNARELAMDSDLDISLNAQKIQKELSGSEFLPISYHQVVSISAVFCDEYGKFIKVGNFSAQGDSKEQREESLIKAFFDYLNKHQPRLVSFNGRGFDMPMLLLRAMKYNLSAFVYFEENNSQLNKNKWENYRQRYCERFHTDLLDSLGSFGAVRGIKLDVVANLVGFPGKFDVSGDMVMDLYYQGEFEKIDEYCQSDVLNTYGVYLSYELLKGNLNLSDYQNLLKDLQEKLPKDKSYSKAFLEAIEKKIKG